MIRSRWLSLAMLCVAALAMACGLPASAPQPKPPARVAFLFAGPSGTTSLSQLATFRDRMRELGYTEGENFIVDVRYAGGNEERLRDLAAEVVRLNVDVIVARGTPETMAARTATSKIPIVMGLAGDPVGTGLVASLARPGGNVTGVASLTYLLGGKQLELLKQAFPGIKRVAVFWNADNPANAQGWAMLESAAAALDVEVLSLGILGGLPDELERLEQALLDADQWGADSLVHFAGPSRAAEAQRIRAFANTRRLPSICQCPFGTLVPGSPPALLSYDPSGEGSYREVAGYVDQLLRGAQPADLPISQPLSTEFGVNLQTAKALGLTIPESILRQATEIIQ